MYQDFKVLDVHGHLSAPWGGVGKFSSWLLATNTALPNPMADGPYSESMTEADWEASLSAHVRALDERGIDVQVIGPRPFMMFGWMPDHLLPRWTEFVNDAIAHQVAAHPTRFLGACQLPQNTGAPDAAHCVPELERCVEELGFVAAYLSPDPRGDRSAAALNDPWWDPLYERAEQLRVPLMVHGSINADQRLASVPHNYQLAFTAEEYFARLVYGHSDVFDRFPDLKVIVCHCGGALDRFISTDWHLPQADRSNNLFFDTCAHDSDFLSTAIRQRGVTQMLFGTEAPGSGGAVRPETGNSADDLIPVLEDMDFLTADDRRAILRENFLRVLPRAEGLA